VIAGVLITAVGVILLLDRFDVLQARDVLRFWPVILILIGLCNLLMRECTGSRVAGAILTVVGTVLLLDRLDLWHVRFRDLWPLILIAIGLLLLWRAIEGPRGVRLPPGSSASRLNEWVVFGGIERRVNSQEFEGGQVFAMFGGVELDLRQAAIKGNRAVIEANSMFGGVEIRVPESWLVTVQGAGVFGGYGDHTHHPAPPAGAETKELLLRGFALFGGVEVKN
jgi:predicted membrane protein